MVIVVNTSVIKNNGIKITSLRSLFNVATDTKLGNGNIIKFFSEMAKGAKTAASSVDDSAGKIQKAFTVISGGAKGAWNSIGIFGRIGLIISAISLAYSVYHDINEKRNQILDDNISQGKTASEGANDLYSTYQKYQQALELGKTVGNDSAGVESAIEGVTKALGKQQEAVDGVTQSYKDMVYCGA